MLGRWTLEYVNSPSSHAPAERSASHVSRSSLQGSFESLNVASHREGPGSQQARNTATAGTHAGGPPSDGDSSGGFGLGAVNPHGPGSIAASRPVVPRLPLGTATERLHSAFKEDSGGGHSGMKARRSPGGVLAASAERSTAAGDGAGTSVLALTSRASSGSSSSESAMPDDASGRILRGAADGGGVAAAGVEAAYLSDITEEALSRSRATHRGSSCDGPVATGADGEMGGDVEDTAAFTDATETTVLADGEKTQRSVAQRYPIRALDAPLSRPIDADELSTATNELSGPAVATEGLEAYTHTHLGLEPLVGLGAEPPLRRNGSSAAGPVGEGAGGGASGPLVVPLAIPPRSGSGGAPPLPPQPSAASLSKPLGAVPAAAGCAWRAVAAAAADVAVTAVLALVMPLAGAAAAARLAVALVATLAHIALRVVLRAPARWAAVAASVAETVAIIVALASRGGAASIPAGSSAVIAVFWALALLVLTGAALVATVRAALAAYGAFAQPPPGAHANVRTAPQSGSGQAHAARTRPPRHPSSSALLAARFGRRNAGRRPFDASSAISEEGTLSETSEATPWDGLRRVRCCLIPWQQSFTLNLGCWIVSSDTSASTIFAVVCHVC